MGVCSRLRFSLHDSGRHRMFSARGACCEASHKQSCHYFFHRICTSRQYLALAFRVFIVCAMPEYPHEPGLAGAERSAVCFVKWQCRCQVLALPPPLNSCRCGGGRGRRKSECRDCPQPQQQPTQHFQNVQTTTRVMQRLSIPAAIAKTTLPKHAA